jgi:uncharacterized repeat protein (TIGR01451 family)
VNFVSSAVRSATRLGRAGIAVLLAIAALPLVLLQGASTVSAGERPVFTMYVPFEDADVIAGLSSIYPPGTFTDAVTTIDITSAADGSIIYWDHWEDGYETDIANPAPGSSTLVWGDNDNSNGSTPGAATDDVDAGTVIFLQNTVELPRNSSDFRFDGRDKVASTRGFAMTRAGWSTDVGTLHAGAVAATDLSKWGTQFDVPVGENIGFAAFDYTGLSVMASDDDTLVEIDTNGDGAYDSVSTLQEGESVYIDGGVNAGASVQSSKPTQAHLLTGRTGLTYEGRWFELFPKEIRGDEYVAAAGSTSDTEKVTVFLHNPGTDTITIAVDAEGTANDANITVGPSAVGSYTLPNQSGARFSSPGNPFIAISGTVAVTGFTYGYDWGYSLVPTSSLTPGVVVGWGKGNPSGDANHSRIWVAPLDNITDTGIEIYADFDGDGTADLIDTNDDGIADAPFITADAFESVAIVDTSDNDATGARIYTQDGTLISVAWGQDPADGECCDAFDLGTAVLPSTALVTTKSHRLVVDLNGDGNVNPGDTLEYTIRSVDAGALALTNINVTDNLPPTLNYVPNTTEVTYLSPSGPTTGGPVSDDLLGTPFPVDEGGIDVPLLQAGAAVEISFRTELVNPFPLFVQNVRNDVNATSDQGNSTATSIVPVVIPDLYIAKTGPTDPVMPGETFDYTLDISNISLAPQTSIDVIDTLPTQVSWNSTTVTRPIDDPAPGGALTTTDTFDTPAYDNNAADWSSNWIETGDDGSAASGDVRIISELGSNRIRLQGDNNSIRRSFDATNWDKAFVNFDWRRESLAAGDSVSFEISTTGGTSWIELDTFAGAADDAGYSNISYDLTRYVGQDIDLRFVTSGLGTANQFFVDDVELVLARRILETVPGNAPSALYSGGELLTGENLTIDISVTVDASIDPTIDDFTNTASTLSAQNATPVMSSWTVDVARASIGDTVWHDQNGDFVVDASEPRLANVELTLYDAVGDFITTTTTDSNGEYLFPDLDPGEYTVTVTDGIIAGFVPMDDDDGDQDGTTDVTLEFGEDNVRTDFGYAIPVSLGDRVFADLDGDGIENGADFAIGTGATPDLDVTITGITPTASHLGGFTTTTSGGDYLFTDLLPGTYEVTVDVSPLSTAAYPTTVDGNTQTHVLTSANDIDTADFGYVIPASIGDLVWHDLDADGIFDAGEPTFSGVTVTAQRTDAAAPAITRTTDANGYYLFANLDAGDYDIVVSTGTGDLPAGFLSSTGGATQSHTVGQDDVVDTADFGFYTPGTIGDLVFNDLNGDGVRDPGEPGLEGLTVSLLDGAIVVDTTTTATGANAGEYDFTNVDPGDYTVSVDTSGFAAGTYTSLDGSALISLRSSDDYDLADFGYVFPATFGDFVFHDLNNNGVWDANGPGTADDEPGIEDVSLTLTSPVLAAPLTTTTDSDGNYLFSTLDPGDYTVTLDTASLPSGYVLSTGGNTHSTTIVSGSSYDLADFGAWTTADIGDFIFHDLNSNGSFDVGEPPLGDVSVTLTGTASSGIITPVTTTTDSVTGLYLFPDLEPGSYTVTVDTATVPAGYVVTAGDDTRSTTLLSDSDDLTLDFGYATTSSIGDLVWDDLDGDGTRDPGEAGIAGADVTIVGTSSGASHPGGSTQQTGANGDYLFDDLEPGTYEVSIALTGVLADTVNSGPGVVTPGVVTQTVTVESDEVLDTVDFGVYTPADIGDLVFEDIDGDGTRDLPDDVGYGGVDITLSGTTYPGGVATAIAPITTTTDTAGAYLFGDLAPGDYTVTLTSSDLPSGAVSTLGGTSQSVTLVSGTDDLDVDFAFFDPSDIGDMVWDDLDGDGIHDAGEPGIDGISIALYSGSTADPLNLMATAITASGGMYSFENLAPGTYTVEIDVADLDPDATITTAGGSTTYTTTVTSGTDDFTLDYGIANPVTLGDTIYEDVNGNGVFDAGEPAITDATGITVTLDGATNVSSTDGTYSFGPLLPGSHTVTVDPATVPTGYTASSPTTITAVYESGDDVDTVDFGFVRPASIGDLVFEDSNGNGVFDSGEPGLAGVTLGITGPGVPLETTYLTTSTGAYSFDDLVPGTFTVTVLSVPAGYTNTVGGASQTTTLASNESDNTLDFGFFQGAAIGDVVFHDLDGDGTQDAGEPGLNNVTVTLYDGAVVDPGNINQTADTGTDDSGAYDFTGLPAGTYTVAVTAGLPAGVVNTLGAPSYTFTVASGDDVDTADFGYYTPATIGDYVWDDLDGNGIDDDGAAADRGIENVTVTLYTGTTVDAGNIVTTDDTDANGAYAFTGLAPGTYTVAIDTADLATNAVSTTGGFVIDTIVVESGDTVDTADFGVANPAAIGDLIFADNDGNGSFSVGDANLDGVTVTLTGGNLGAGSLVDTTGADGIYGFTDLYPGDYTVTVTPTGDLDGDEFSTTGGSVQTVTVVSGQTDDTIDFGYAEPASIGDTLFHDLDADGVQDAGEPGLGDVDITITGTSAGASHQSGLTIQTGTGGSLGQYAFTGLQPGDYTIVVDTADTDMNVAFVSTTGGDSQTATLSAGQNIDTIDFGYAAPVTIGDFVFTDPDGNGDQADAVALGGVQLELRDALDGLVATTTSDATTGAYSFTGVMPGNYRVDVVGGLPVGAFSTTGGNSQTLTAVSATDIDTIDFGYAQPATIGNQVYVDADASGTFDGGESGSTATITITGTSAGASHPAGTSIEATGGSYSMTGLNPGTYDVSVSDLPAGATLTQGASGHTITVESGETDNSADFGYWLPASIGNEVFEDMNADGDRDLDDLDYAGVTLTLTGPGVPANTTATSGSDYSFDGLAPGTYTVTVTTAPAGAVNTLGGSSQTVTITSGETNDTVDFGFYEPSTIGDYVFDDLNGDGLQNDGAAADRGVAGVELTLTRTDGTPFTPVTDTTDSSGGYDFGSLAPGTYQVAITSGLPAGAVSTTGGTTISTIVVTSGTDENDVDFGIALPASLGDMVFEDVDGDGTLDAGDTGFSNVTITVQGTSANASHQAGTTITTGSGATAGDYGLGGLLPGTYDVTVSTGTGDLPATAASSTGGDTQTVTLISGQTDTTLDFGYTLPASIGDQLFVDNNANGVFDAGDTGLGLVDVTLTGPGQGAGNTQATLADGSYDFTELAPGEYTVTVDVDDPQFVAVFGSGASSTAISSTGGNAQTLTISSTDNIDTVDFGYYALGSIGDFVFTDANGDGDIDLPDDTGIESITVTLDGGDLAGPITTTTGTGASAGDYLFDDLTPGTYTVTATVAGQTATTPGAAGGTVQTITLLSGGAIDTADFGFIAPASLGDLLFDDLDGDGVFDAGEPGLEGVTVTLTGTTAAGAITPVVTTTGTTAGGDAGEYGFDDLLPGDYTVTVSTDTGDLAAATYTSTTGGDSQTLSLASGDDDTTVDFGYVAPGAIGDFVFDDLDGDGVQDAGEPGLGGVVVRISGGDLAAPITTTTGTGGSLGQYTFAGLAPGTYTVEIVSGLPTGAVQTLGDGAITVTLDSNESLDDVDFGAYMPISIGDLVFTDENGNATFGAAGGDAPISGVELTLSGAALATDLVDTTDVNGIYGFDSLAPGTYTLTLTGGVPADHVSTTGGNSVTFTLVSGTDDFDLDFGLVEPATIGDLVWHDTNGNGTFDSGEPGIGGVQVELVDGGGAVVATQTTTAGTGAYEFTNVTPAPLDYTVRIVAATVPTGYTATTPQSIDLTITSGDDVDTADFGYVTTTSIGDFVWDDTNGDGVQDAGEDGLGGLTVTLTGGALVTPLVDTTDGNGAYLFENLAPGTYTVTVTPPANAATTTGGNSQTLTVLSGSPDDTIDFGYAFGAAIGDRIWHDLDADGIDDGEPGLASVEVLLNGNGLSLSDTTDGTGAYSFTGLAPGEYTITINATTVPVGANSGAQLTPTTAITTTLTVESGDLVDTVDYGYATTATIGDTIFDDLGGDGVLDLPAEPGLDAITVELVDSGDNVVATDVTDDGAYEFAGVAPGDYTVRVVTASLPAGYAQTTNPSVASVSVESDELIDTVDLGFARPSTIGDFIWHDLDADGAFDAGEPALSGVTVNVYDGGLNLVGTDDTDSNGAYLVTGLEPGTYTVQVDIASLPNGANSGTQMVASASVPSSISRTVESGDSVVDADFAFHTTATIGDQIWHDLDADGNDDDGPYADAWLDTVVVELIDASDDSVVASTTATDGAYSFAGVAPGTYEVRVDETTVPATHSSTTGNNPATVTVVSDELVDDVDFGYAALTGGSIGNEIFDDLDGDGVRDAGEPGIELTVELWSGGALVDSRTTTAGGYTFANLAPGTYEVRVVESSIPAGYASSTTTGANVSNGGNTQTFTIQSGDAPIVTADFGYVAAATVGDYVWHDLNADGIQNDGAAADVGLAGVTVELRNGATVVDSDVTDANGAYQLTAAPGSYDVVVLGTSVPDGANSGSQMTATTASSTPVTLISNEIRTDVDFGYATTASIGDTIFDDLDGDGIEQAGEPGLPGVTVELFDGVSTVTTTTGPNGEYTFSGLAPGDYSVSVVASSLPTGALATTTTDPVDVTVESDDLVDTVDLGFTLPGTITGEIFVDADASGTLGAGESNVATELDVDLLDDGGFVVDTVTTVGGVYTFTDVVPGDYTVRPSIPAGSFLTVPDVGGDDTIDSDIDPSTSESHVITMTSGAAITDVDAGVYELATIGDTVFVDLDGNGTQTSDEPGLAGVAVAVRDAGGNVIGSATTDADGIYSVDVLPGTHTVSITVPSGYAAGVGGTSQPVTIASGGTDDTIDFPVVGAGELSGSVVYDVENDGGIDADDPGLGGITVTATWDGPDGPVEYTTTTDSDGAYSFAGLPPGDFTVVVDPTTLPDGIVDPTVDPDSTVDLETVATVGGGTPATDIDFAVSGTASLGDNVFLDENQNGRLDPGETGVPGVTVIATVSTRAGVMTYTTVTDSNGNYEFTDLPAGDYSISIDTTTVPAGMRPTVGTLTATLVINGADDSVDVPLVQVAGPVAIDDADTTQPSTPVTIAVLDDDDIRDGTTVTVTSITQPPNGTAILNTDGTVTYTPNDGFDGTDTFEYTICDLGGLEAAGDTPANRAIFCSTASVDVVTPAAEVVAPPTTTPTGTTPPTTVPTTPTTTPTSTTTGTTSDTPNIPRAGAENGSIQLLGLGLLLVGLALWAVSRRRRDDDDGSGVSSSNAWPAPTL